MSVSGLNSAYAAGQSLTTKTLGREAGETVPPSVLRDEDIAAMRTWAHGAAVRA